jgi:hypothetical protein
MSAWLSFAAVAVAAFLAWNLYRRFGADRLEAFNEKRRPTSRLVSRGQLVEGNRQVDVALALNNSTFFYENADMQASLELIWVTEIEYDTQLSTGRSVAGGKVLRLRCYSQLFEFILPDAVATRWPMALPPRRAVASRETIPASVLVPVVSA